MNGNDLSKDKQLIDVDPCVACPFRDGENEEATMAQNYGCLPTHSQMLDEFDLTGIALSCHNDDAKACRGLAKFRDVTNTKVKAYSDWYHNG